MRRSRKHAITLLGAKNGWGGVPGANRECPPKDDRKVEEVLCRIRKLAEQPRSRSKGGRESVLRPYSDLSADFEPTRTATRRSGRTALENGDVFRRGKPGLPRDRQMHGKGLLTR
jgi:hypothetical protein